MLLCKTLSQFSLPPSHHTNEEPVSSTCLIHPLLYLPSPKPARHAARLNPKTSSVEWVRIRLSRTVLLVGIATVLLVFPLVPALVYGVVGGRALMSFPFLFRVESGYPKSLWLFSIVRLCQRKAIPRILLISLSLLTLPNQPPMGENRNMEPRISSVSSLPSARRRTERRTIVRKHPSSWKSARWFLGLWALHSLSCRVCS